MYVIYYLKYIVRFQVADFYRNQEQVKNGSKNKQNDGSMSDDDELY